MTDHRRLPATPTWGTLFGVVPDRGMHRRPSEIVRVVLGVLLLALGAAMARNLTTVEAAFRNLVVSLPDPLIEAFRVLNGAAVVIAVLVVLGAALAARRIRFIGGVLVAAALSAAIGWGLQGVVDAPGAVASSATIPGAYPDYPTLRLSVLAAVFFVAAPELTRPARRVQWSLLVLVSVSAIAVTDGYPSGILGSLALGWAVAALVHLAFGSPDGVPDPDEIRSEAEQLGVVIDELTPSATRIWGEQTLEGTDREGDLRVVVLGRDARDAQFLSKLFRFVWYKDSGPSVSFSRAQQLDHRAVVLLLAERAGIPAPTVITAGSGGRGDALLLLRQSPASPLPDLDHDQLTDAVLASAWSALHDLHRIGIAHQGLAPDGLRLRRSGAVAFTDLGTADTQPDDDALLADRAALLVTLAALTDEERAIRSARDALGDEGLTAVVPMLQPAALPRVLQRSVTDVRHLTGRLRDGVASTVGVEPPALIQLHRVSITNLLMAAGTILGVYLLIGQLSEVDFSTVFNDADWVWIPVIAVFSQLPQIGNSIAMLGSVRQQLPLRPVVGVNFANQFTGLVGGSVANAALAIRFFQRQGMTAAVAVSSGVLVSAAAAVVQTILVVVGLFLVGTAFSVSSTTGGSSSSGGSSGAQDFIKLFLVLALVLGLSTLVPRVRRRLAKVVVPQVRSAWDNLRSIAKDPIKGLQLFGGNFISQLFFALTLWAALECYGQSLGIMELIVINSFASVLGGIMPVPGGMGVIEAGLIGGFTAAGIPQDQAVAATFTARLFTAYLPPIWGWFALAWLRRREYV